MSRPLRFSCTSFSFPLLRLSEIAQLLGLLGFTHLDLCVAEGEREVRAADVEAAAETAAVRDRAAVEDAGLGVVDVFAHLGTSAFDRPLNTPDGRQRERDHSRMGSYLRYARAVGAEGLTISPGKRWAELPNEGLDLACQELAIYCGWAAEAGLRLSVEPHLDSIAATPAEAERLVELVPGLSLTVDYSHFIAQGFTQSEVDRLLPLAGHVHVRQAAPGKLQATEEDGVIDFDAVIGKLMLSGYRGALTLEYVWSRWQGMNKVDVVTETLLLRHRLEERLGAISFAG